VSAADVYPTRRQKIVMPRIETAPRVEFDMGMDRSAKFGKRMDRRNNFVFVHCRMGLVGG
jgi:hypothetical protein